MKKKLIIWILILVLLLGGAGCTYYLFSIGAIGFELPEATDPAKRDLITLYAEPARPTAPPAPTEPAPTEPLPTEPETSTEANPRVISATTYFVYDLREKEFLTLSGKSTQTTYPASITKLMTAYTALQYMQPDDTIVVGSEIQLINWDSSKAFLREGDVMTVGQCIHAMLLPSGNDAAYSLAVNVGRKVSGKPGLEAQAAINVFVREMNQVAAELGMDHSHFNNPDGMHISSHFTCPEDLVTLMYAMMDTPVILNAAQTLKYSGALENRTATWTNTNLLLNENTRFYEPNAMGLKTGYTSYAGNCLLSLFFDDDRLYLIGTFGCPTTLDRYLDTQKLYADIFEEN